MLANKSGIQPNSYTSEWYQLLGLMIATAPRRLDEPRFLSMPLEKESINKDLSLEVEVAGLPLKTGAEIIDSCG